jgi:hypothetical protein
MRRILILPCLLLVAAAGCGDDTESTTTITEAAAPEASSAPAATSAPESTAAPASSDAPATTTAPATTGTTEGTTPDTAATAAEVPTTVDTEAPLTEQPPDSSVPDAYDIEGVTVEPASEELLAADELEALAPKLEEVPAGFEVSADETGPRTWDDFIVGEEDEYVAKMHDAGWVGAYRTTFNKGQEATVQAGTTAVRDEAGAATMFAAGIEQLTNERSVKIEEVQAGQLGDESKAYRVSDDEGFAADVVLWRQGNTLNTVFYGYQLAQGEQPPAEPGAVLQALSSAYSERIAGALGA